MDRPGKQPAAAAAASGAQPRPPAAEAGYALVDFGQGRKLERFGSVLLDRPCPTCDTTGRRLPEAWRQADARYQRGRAPRGVWVPERALPPEWCISLAGLTFQLRASPFGHVGLFAEQQANWGWLGEQVRGCGASGLRVLNLFAYTGGSSLAAAAAGAQVVHVDAAKNIVTRARNNAELSGLAAAPIRWIVEDAMKFCRRELRRKQQYQVVVLDPPSYGTGPGRQRWQWHRDLPELLALCADLTRDDRVAVLATCHTTGVEAAELARRMAEASLTGRARDVDRGPMQLSTSTGRQLPAGVFARWPKR